MEQRPFTPESLAGRWHCSAEKIRTMCRTGELKFFKLGKLIRIPATEVDRIECRTSSTDLLSTVESLPSQLDQVQLSDEFRLARMI